MGSGETGPHVDLVELTIYVMIFLLPYPAVWL